MRCSSCAGVFHPSTGQFLSKKTTLCGSCVKDFVAWLKGHTNRRFGKMRFYDYTETSRDKKGT